MLLNKHSIEGWRSLFFVDSVPILAIILCIQTPVHIDFEPLLSCLIHYVRVLMDQWSTLTALLHAYSLRSLLAYPFYRR